MKKVILSIVFFAFLFLVKSAVAVDITGCQNITSSGTYKLVNNITATTPGPYGECIWIQASDVIFDMQNYEIRRGAYNVYKGILVMHPDGATLSNVLIEDGTIRDFFEGTGVYVYRVSYGSLNNMDIHSNSLSTGIDIRYSDHFSVYNSKVHDGNKWGLYIAAGSNNKIDKNKFYLNTYDIMAVSETNLTVSTNELMTLQVYNYSECQPTWYFIPFPILAIECTKYSIPAYDGSYYGIIANYTHFSTFSGNSIYTRMNDFVLGGDSHNNSFYYNTLLYSDTLNGLWLLSGTYNNYGCGNKITYLYNYGTNNIFETTCPAPPPEYPCTEGFDCWYNYRVYVLPDCSFKNQTYCQYGCNTTTKDCNPAPVVPPYMPPPMEAIPGVNATEWQQQGWGWALFFFTPFFLSTFLAIMISGAVGVVSKNGGIVGVIFIAFLLAFTISGIYPSWVGIVMIIVAAGVTAFMIGRQFGLV